MLKLFMRLFMRKEDEQKFEEEAVEAREREIEAEQKQSAEFVTETPNEGSWLETDDQNGQRLYLPLLQSPLVFGTSEDCDVRLDERLKGVDKVKSKHARVEYWQGRWVIVPIDKDAPVFINGKRTGENVLRDGMEVCLGENGVQFVFREGKSGSEQR